MLADAMHSMDVPHDPDSLTRTFPFRITCSQTVYLYVPIPVSHVSLTLPIWIVDSSMLTISSYAYSFCLVDLSVELLFLDYDSFMTRLPFTTICTCISQSRIYMVGDGDSSLIFNLLCNHPKSVTCEIPHTLLIPSSSLAKATALRP